MTERHCHGEHDSHDNATITMECFVSQCRTSKVSGVACTCTGSHKHRCMLAHAGRLHAAATCCCQLLLTIMLMRNRQCWTVHCNKCAKAAKNAYSCSSQVCFAQLLGSVPFKLLFLRYREDKNSRCDHDSGHGPDRLLWLRSSTCHTGREAACCRTGVHLALVEQLSGFTNACK